MGAMAQFAILAVATALAAAAALGMAGAFLWGAFHLMPPAPARPGRPDTALVRGTRAASRPFAMRG
jgi:hypothetical protein